MMRWGKPGRYNTKVGRFIDVSIYPSTDISSNIVGIPRVIASGGDVSIWDNYKMHTFLESSTFTVHNPGDVSIFIVGGGGHGGTYYDPGTAFDNYPGGGGGAGEVIETSLFLEEGTYTITVGDSDEDSAIGTKIIAKKGEPAQPGNSSPPFIYNDGGDSGSGNIGGTHWPNVGYVPTAGGGAGQGGNGGDASPSAAGDGGSGIFSDFSGIKKPYAGGGGGGGRFGETPGTGGTFTGGNGGNSSIAASNGVPNTGGGGGGAYIADYGQGGSGIVMIKYITNTNGYNFSNPTLGYGQYNVGYIPKMVSNNMAENYNYDFVVKYDPGKEAGDPDGVYKAFDQDAGTYLACGTMGATSYCNIWISLPKNISIWKYNLSMYLFTSGSWASMAAQLFYDSQTTLPIGNAQVIPHSGSGVIENFTETFSPTQKSNNYFLKIWNPAGLDLWTPRIYSLQIYPYYSKYTII